MDDARFIAGAMKRRGYHIHCKSQASYLGTDLGAGVRHARANRTQRLTRHGFMHRKIARLARATRRYRVTGRLAQQGGQAAGAY
eukprot:3393356-Pyramimonas_sp.AAC.1